MTIYSSLSAKVSSQQVQLTSTDFTDLKELFTKTTSPTSDPSPRINDNTGERNEWLDNASTIEQITDNRTNPNLSLPRDVSMIDRFLASPTGQIFTNNQNAYQKLNTFSETRVPTTEFIISNTKKPHSHTARPSNNAGKVLLIGDNPQSAPGHAGRLQMETSDFVINTTGVSNLTSFMGTSGFAAGILGGVQRAAVTAAHNIGQNLLNNAMANVGGVAGDVLRGVGNIALGGSLGVDQRPELMVNGQYYSVILNQIQQKSYKDMPRNSDTARAVSSDTPSAGARIGSALGQLGTRMATSAATSLLSMGTNALSGRSGGNITDVLINGTVSGEIATRIKSQLRATGDSTARHRYFIKPSDNTSHGFGGFASAVGSSMVSSLGLGTTSKLDIEKYWVGIGSIDERLESFRNWGKWIIFEGALGALDIKDYHGVIPDGLSLDSNLPDGISSSYSGSTYNKAVNLRSINIAAQVQGGIDFATRKRGWRFGPTPSEITAQRPNAHHYVDMMNIGVGVSSSVIFPVTNHEWVTSDSNPDNLNDYIDVIFINVVHGQEIRVRSLISNISEKVSPQYEGTTRYIGRVEKPIVYGGVDRELSFTLILHAFSSSELKGIWEKVNFITSLTYPQNYVRGFMVPPLAKITIGNMYRVQSGYITSLTKTIDEQYRWDIDIPNPPYSGSVRNNQLPTTVKLEITFAIIDNYRRSGVADKFHGRNLWEPDPPALVNTTATSPAPSPAASTQETDENMINAGRMALDEFNARQQELRREQNRQLQWDINGRVEAELGAFAHNMQIEQNRITSRDTAEAIAQRQQQEDAGQVIPQTDEPQIGS